MQRSLHQSSCRALHYTPLGLDERRSARFGTVGSDEQVGPRGESDVDDVKKKTLAGLLHYLKMAGYPNSEIIKRSNFADQFKPADQTLGEGGSASKTFENYISKGTIRDDRVRPLLAYVQKLAMDKTFYNEDRPPYVIAAIRTLFPDAPVPADGRVNATSVFDGVTDFERKRNDTLAELYAGVWIGFRYSAHASGEALTDDKGKPDPRVVRTAMQIFPPNREEGQQLNTFRVHYRPRARGDKRPPPKERKYFVTTGAIHPITECKHAYFVGLEQLTQHPFTIVANLLRSRVDQFTGFFTRQQDMGAVNFGKVVLVRSNDSLEQQTELVDVYERESELLALAAAKLPNIASILAEAKISAEYDGRSSFLI